MFMEGNKKEINTWIDLKYTMNIKISIEFFFANVNNKNVECAGGAFLITCLRPVPLLEA